MIPFVMICFIFPRKPCNYNRRVNAFCNIWFVVILNTVPSPSFMFKNNSSMAHVVEVSLNLAVGALCKIDSRLLLAEAETFDYVAQLSVVL